MVQLVMIGIGPYDAIQRYTFGSNYYNGVSGVGPNSTFGNNKLAWESVNQFNIGMDLALLKGRLSFTADYYNKTTRIFYTVLRCHLTQDIVQ
jgi:outer membrane receptor protein involved in Fe transport